MHPFYLIQTTLVVFERPVKALGEICTDICTNDGEECSITNDPKTCVCSHGYFFNGTTCTAGRHMQ